MSSKGARSPEGRAEKSKRSDRPSKKSSDKEKDEGKSSAVPTRKSNREGATPAPIIKTKSDKSLTGKGNEKSKKRKSGRQTDLKKKGTEGKKRGKTAKKSLYEKILLGFGFFVGNVTLHDPRAIEAAQALDLKQWHLRRLRAKFDQIDIDGSGNIDFDEFFEAIGELRSPFTDKLFSLIDIDGSGTIEFDEFVRVLATYCMFSKDEILRFCFECFDVDRSGTIDEKEFVELCK